MKKTDVLIVGAGPTGLMMGCQLARFGIPFRIIDKGVDRAHESRAPGVQAKSMELFQNLGLADQFLKHAKIPGEGRFYFNNVLKFTFDFNKIHIPDTPFPKIYFIPQSNTAQILASYLENKKILIERQNQLLSFKQTPQEIHAEILNLKTNKKELISCRYIVGCDGSQSTVRTILNIPFVGASYEQEFLLADAEVTGAFAKEGPSLFFNKKGVFGLIPLTDRYTRIIISGMKFKAKEQPTLQEIESYANNVLGIKIALRNPFWISRFHLHHRAVEQYQKGRAFLAGDAAHIHSPVGGQGMNTGLQDAANLAWKITFTLKCGASEKLLDTYQTERAHIGKILLKTTDRIFGFMTSKNPIIIFLRQYVVPFCLQFLTPGTTFQRKVFCFLSELGIHYHENPYIAEVVKGADKQFLQGPKAGYRAPDAPVNGSTLFEVLREKPSTLLIFESGSAKSQEHEKQILQLMEMHPEWMDVKRYVYSSETQVLFDRFGVSDSAIYFIRPDGYIGYRSYSSDLSPLTQYLSRLFEGT